MELMRDIIATEYNGLSLYERYKIIYSFKNCQRTELKYLAHWGSIEGKRRWSLYCNNQAKSNTFEYKQKKFGWSKEEFDAYNAKRAVTLENLIARHGEEVGTKMWNEYCNKQREAGITLDYFQHKYGNEDGVSRYQSMLDKKLEASLSAVRRITSNLELNILTEIRSIGLDLYSTNHTIKRDDGEVEVVPSYQFKLRAKENGKYEIYPYDGCILEHKILIEVHGDYWHKNPRSKNILRAFSSDLTLQQQAIIKRLKTDETKKQLALDSGFRLYVVWEMDWNRNREAILEHLVSWVNSSNEVYFSTEELFPNDKKG